MSERWKAIEGFEGRYEVSDQGNVRSILFVNNIVSKQRIKTKEQTINSQRRCYVNLERDGRRKNCLVHRLVAKAFIPNPMNLSEVNHIDGNPTNNNISNLEWCTKQYNMKHAYENNLSKLKPYNEKHKKPIKRSDGKVYDCAYSAADDLSVSVFSIRDVLKGRINSCKGYTFEYL